jgi:hypothetical protein
MSVIYCLPIPDISNENYVEYNAVSQLATYSPNDQNEIQTRESKLWTDTATILVGETIYERVISKTMINLNNKPGEWPRQSSHSCFWCCNKFDTIPIFLPTKCVNGVYHVRGNFCSFNCTLAYAQLHNDQTNNYAELLHKMARTIYNKPVEITPAPSKEVLLEYGGTITIDEFRNSFQKCYPKYDIIHPPIVSLVSTIVRNKEMRDINEKITHQPQKTPLKSQQVKRRVQRKLFN